MSRTFEALEITGFHIDGDSTDGEGSGGHDHMVPLGALKVLNLLAYVQSSQVYGQDKLELFIVLLGYLVHLLILGQQEERLDGLPIDVELVLLAVRLECNQPIADLFKDFGDLYGVAFALLNLNAFDDFGGLGRLCVEQLIIDSPYHVDLLHALI